MDPSARFLANRRLTFFAGFVLLWAVLIFLKLVFLQIVHHKDYLSLATRRQTVTVEIPAPRGSIYDRTGQLLAMSVNMESVSINPQHVPDLGIASELLARMLKLDREVLYGRMKWAKDLGRGYLPVKKKISQEESRALHSLNLEWIQFESASQRHYPSGQLAAHILGGVDHEERGNAGIEKALDDDLTGMPGIATVLTDVHRRGITSRVDTPPRPGTPITLTIDERIQFPVEQALAAAVEGSHAERGSVVVMNPYNGDILAMASYPTYDPNIGPVAKDNPIARQNGPVSAPFEPGSVFKVITLTAALETTSLRPDTIINCGNGTITLFGRTIHEAKHGYGSIPMALVLAKSSNIGAIQIGLKVGQQNMYDYVRKMGFGQRTGIPLPAESPGMVRRLTRWGATSLSSVAMGHEIGTTTLQLAQACSIVANGGALVRPRLLLRKGNQTQPPSQPQRVIRPETAFTMRQMMEGVVILPSGTGHKARLDGYTSAGKTGSAQIYDFANHHYTHTYNGSYMGFAPVTNPAIVVVVTINGTHGTAGFGGQVAAPVFKIVAQEALRVLDVPKDIPEVSPEDLKPETVPVEGQDLSIADLKKGEDDDVLADAEEQATNPQPPAPRPQPPQSSRVPNFRGMSMRQVMAEASSKGLAVVVDGSGVARRQEPRPGTVLRAGERIRVQFAR